ncbi:MAG: DUF1501 domain-containing protein, partial [Planctomycetaceae bacterium]
AASFFAQPDDARTGQVPTYYCPSRRSAPQVSRAGADDRAGAAGLTGALATERRVGADAIGFGRAKSCVVLFLMGGAPQHSTWDPKPEAIAEIRGQFGPIATSVPGLQVGELFPCTAQVADRLAILRAVSTGDNAHSSSGY